MAKLIALYNRPADAQAFDGYYFAKHVPLAKTIPGLRRYEVSAGPVTAEQGESPFHLAAILSFDTMRELEDGLNSPQGQQTAADLANFAGAGVEVLTFESRDV